MRRWLAQPVVPSLLVLGFMVVAGFVAIGLAWRIAAATLVVAFQTPAVVSGGLVGLALILLGAGLISTQLGRHWAAQERQEREGLLEEAAQLLETVSRDRR